MTNVDDAEGSGEEEHDEVLEDEQGVETTVDGPTIEERDDTEKRETAASASASTRSASSDADSDSEPKSDSQTATVGDEDDRYTRKKSVLITGCSSGIGRATATAFLHDDWQVFATARDTDDIEALAEAGCTTFELDVTDPDQVSRAVERVVDEADAIDCVVNNAGYAQMGPMEDISTSDLHRQFDVNVYGPHRLVRAALPHMRAQGAGRIINVSSVFGRVSFAGSGAYSGSKHALEAMSDSLRAEVEEFDIDVVVIEPGPVETNFADRVGEELPETERSPAYETLYELYEEMRLIGGGSGGPFASEPDDVAEAILESARAPEPPARYPVGPLAQYGVYARFLPDTLRDTGYRLLRKLV
ncbi:SDR family oxidoreductase [Natronolimnohabitans innermongolicus]|uniref:Short-chain dehydrogenase/reductase SDR n=1 Tax=Natronolimnohabitans innermongolicus JCM 12255 TaxID=1227499 RepID=L9WSA9_9EURY|nr:SDR family oxidoreductase [Natronolimnohabitans innermongolicus]ELY51193.1 short-chain dehydrogenase/reductase SDR [Natronolimnohabitans innermongolicus JCM 12255]